MSDEEPPRGEETAQQDNVSRPDYEPLTQTAAGDEAPTPGEAELAAAGGMTVRLAASLGGCEMPLKELLALREGDRVTLDKAVDAPVELIVNGEVVGEGELVVVDDNFGVRILRMAERQGG